MEKMLVKVAEAADLASISRAKAYELIAAGEWPSVRIGRTIRVPVGRLSIWIDEHIDGAAQSRQDAPA